MTGYLLEKEIKQDEVTKPKLIDHESYTAYYKHYFYSKGNEWIFVEFYYSLHELLDHKNFIGEHAELGPVIVSVESPVYFDESSKDEENLVNPKLRTLIKIKHVSLHFNIKFNYFQIQKFFTQTNFKKILTQKKSFHIN